MCSYFMLQNKLKDILVKHQINDLQLEEIGRFYLM